MPFIRLETSMSLSGDVKTRLCAELSRACAEVIGKPETYVQAIISDGATMLHAGKPGSAAFVDVRSIGGLSSKTNKALAKRLCDLIHTATQISGERIYLNFTDVAATHWGHDGGTFG
jgi:Macrophage migration inhibitory factor (MIF).